MNALTSLDVLYMVGASCLLVVSVFLAWALYELARLIRQTNDVVEDTREKVSSVSHYLGFIADTGKQLMTFLHRRDERTDVRDKKKRNRL